MSTFDSILSRLLSPSSLLPPDTGSTMPQLVLTCRSHIQDVMCVMGRFFDPPPRFLSMGLAKPNFQIQPGTVPLYPLCAVSTVSWSTASFNGRGGSHTRLHATSIKGHLEVVPSPFKTVQILNLVTLKAGFFECTSPIQDVDFTGYLSRLDPSACCTARYVHRDIARLLLLGSRGAE